MDEKQLDMQYNGYRFPRHIRSASESPAANEERRCRVRTRITGVGHFAASTHRAAVRRTEGGNTSRIKRRCPRAWLAASKQAPRRTAHHLRKGGARRSDTLLIGTMRRTSFGKNAVQKRAHETTACRSCPRRQTMANIEWRLRHQALWGKAVNGWREVIVSIKACDAFGLKNQ